MNAFRVLVVDDEPLAREMVVALARMDPQVETVEACAEAAQTAGVVARFKPDIVLLDVQMPELDGIRIAEGLSESGPVVVFITAHSEYAMDAFEVGAVDYLLKPFTDERFREALTRAKRRVHERHLAREAPALVAQDPAHASADRVVEFGTVALRPAHIVWIEAQDYYVRIHTAHERFLVRATLASLEQRLDPAQFLRVHRNAIVNRDEVRDSVEHDGGLRLTLADGTQVPVSRARRRAIAVALRRDSR